MKYQITHADKFGEVEADSVKAAAEVAHRIFNAEHAIDNTDRLEFIHDEQDRDDHIVTVKSEGGNIGFMYWVYPVAETTEAPTEVD